MSAQVLAWVTLPADEDVNAERVAILHDDESGGTWYAIERLDALGQAYLARLHSLGDGERKDLERKLRNLVINTLGAWIVDHLEGFEDHVTLPLELEDEDPDYRGQRESEGLA